jgi:molybdenum cofactor guanylyltransferase
MKLYGLVLAGGKSSRMGFDKAFLDFHGAPQVRWLHKLLQKYCEAVYVSGPGENIPRDIQCIKDFYETGGPMNGVLSAFRLFPDVAWLVMPVDMPNVGEVVISYLIKNRDEKKLATCFVQSGTKTIEPFPVLIEPLAYPRMVDRFQKNKTSMNDFLKSNDIMKIEVLDPEWLVNVNSRDQL